MKRKTVRTRRMIAAAIAVATLLVALLAVTLFSWPGQTAQAQDPDDVVLVHVNPDGTDYAGNLYCPDGGLPVDDDGDTAIDRWIDDCNNIAGQFHVIRTERWDPASMVADGWELDPAGVGQVLISGRCGDVAEVTSRSDWDPSNDEEQCVVIHSAVPGETGVVLTYTMDTIAFVTEAVIKEWDSLVDTVILKAPPADEDGDTDIDADDHHLADQQGTWEDAPVIWDEGQKRVRSAGGPVRLVEIVHGEHDVLINAEWITLHHPTEGAIFYAEIDSDNGCTYFTDPTGTENFGDAMNGLSDSEGRFVGPRVAPAQTQGVTSLAPDSHTGLSAQGDYDIRDIYIDTVCEEQAIITIHAGYPGPVGSLFVPADEWLGINWATMEEAKQPQIRWAGELIVLAKRWALLDSYYPNTTTEMVDDTAVDVYQDVCPNVGKVVQYNREDPSPGALEGGIPDIISLNGPDSVSTFVTYDCASRAMYESDGPGQVDVRALQWEYGGEWLLDQVLHQDSLNTCIDLYNNIARNDADGGARPELEDLDGDFDVDEDDLELCLSLEDLMWHDLLSALGPSDLDFVVNKHAFLVWYLKIYQVTLTNVDGERADHNESEWVGDVTDTSGDTEEDTLNVSADTLLRVRVKGWYYGGSSSSRGSVCIDRDGDGDGAGSEAGVPYPTTGACADVDDELLAAGHWVLPDDLVVLAGPDPALRIPSWDVMSDIDEAPSALSGSGYYIGPKSTLDSHDNIVRPWVPCLPPDHCGRKTVDPDGDLTVADAIMPVLTITAQIADPSDAGFLEEALKVNDLDLASLHEYYMIPYDPEIPWQVANGGYGWNSWVNILGPYEFYHVFSIMAAPGPLENTGIGNQDDQSADDPSHPRQFQFYTDNRGEGFFFANGDYNLSFDDCVIQALFGTPDCAPGDVAGQSTIRVIGDYPYFRKHAAIWSNPVVKTWTWGGFKEVTAEPIDATHTAIIAHLKDRDGFCKYDVDVADTIDVTFSPSEHPVQGEEITFFLNTEVGSIVAVSSHAGYDAPHTPLGDATVIFPVDGVIIDPTEAVALAEDARVLDGMELLGMVPVGSRVPIEEDECQAWVVVEHPVGQLPYVTVYFDDPEGTVVRPWPPSFCQFALVPGWNDSCYCGPEKAVDDAMVDLLVDSDGDTVLDLIAVYRLDNQTKVWQRYFPERPDISNLATVSPYDQLFVLMQADAVWEMEITPAPNSAELAQGWNSICYAGSSKAVEDATASIAGDFSILLTYASDQTWRRYMPGRLDLTDIVTLNQFTSVVMLVTAQGGATWVFDPPGAPSGPAFEQSSEEAVAGRAPAALPASPDLAEFCSPVIPGTYNGAVTVGGAPAPDGTVITALMDGIEWASTTTSGGVYVFEVPQSMPVSEPCFVAGTVSFACDGIPAAESDGWTAGPRDLDLTCGEVPPSVTVRVDQGISIEARGVPGPGLGAYTVDAHYNADALSPVTCDADPGGNFDSSLCNMTYTPDSVRATGIRAECGLVGEVPLAIVEFEPAPPVCPDDLLVSVETLADCEGADILSSVDDKWWVGDADRDFDKDAVDALFILQYVVGMRDGNDQCPPPPGEIHLPSADADCDGDVDAVDALFVLQHVVGMRPELCPAS